MYLLGLGASTEACDLSDLSEEDAEISARDRTQKFVWDYSPSMPGFRFLHGSVRYCFALDDYASAILMLNPVKSMTRRKPICACLRLTLSGMCMILFLKPLPKIIQGATLHIKLILFLLGFYCSK